MALTQTLHKIVCEECGGNQFRDVGDGVRECLCCGTRYGEAGADLTNGASSSNAAGEPVVLTDYGAGVWTGPIESDNDYTERLYKDAERVSRSHA